MKLKPRLWSFLPLLWCLFVFSPRLTVKSVQPDVVDHRLWTWGPRALIFPSMHSTNFADDKCWGALGHMKGPRLTVLTCDVTCQTVFVLSPLHFSPLNKRGIPSTGEWQWFANGSKHFLYTACERSKITDTVHLVKLLYFVWVKSSLVPWIVIVSLMAAFSVPFWNSRHLHFLWWSVGFRRINSFEKHSEGFSKVNLFPFKGVLSSQLHTMCIFLFLQGKYPLYVFREQWSSTMPSLDAVSTLTGELKKYCLIPSSYFPRHQD